MISRRNLLGGAAGLAFPALAGCGGTPPTGSGFEQAAASRHSVPGLDAVIDISHNVTVTDFAAVRRSNILAVLHNVTAGGDWFDPSYGPRRRQAEAAGLLWGGYHFGTRQYSGEKQAALKTVRELLQLARKSDVIPMPASEYAGMADDFFTTSIEQTGLFNWTIRNRGTLATVRFDDADLLAVDVAASIGVLGGNRHAGALYVSLDPAVAEPVVALRSREQAEEALRTPAPTPTEPLLSLVEGRWQLSGRQVKDCEQTVTAQGFGNGDLTFEGKSSKPFRIKVSRNGQVLNEEIRWTGPDGRLSLHYAIDAREPVELRFSCHE